jgi:hypothetical protein
MYPDLETSPAIFVTGGCTAMYLCRELTDSTPPYEDLGKRLEER